MEDFFESVLNKIIAEIKPDHRFLNLSEKFGVARLVAKQDLILSGAEFLKYYIKKMDEDLNYVEYFQSGQEVLKDQTVFQIDGNLDSLLKIQKTALEPMELFSGLATQTKNFVKTCKGSPTKVLESCKPIPGYAPWYKRAMKNGGAVKYPPHLEGHFNIDQRHIEIAGGLKNAFISFQKRNDSPIAVDVRTPEEVKTACQLKISHIRFENKNREKIKESLKLIPEDIQTEIFGSICLKDISEILKLKVDYLNLESLTHSFNPVGFEIIFNRE